MFKILAYKELSTEKCLVEASREDIQRAVLPWLDGLSEKYLRNIFGPKMPYPIDEKYILDSFGKTEKNTPFLLKENHNAVGFGSVMTQIKKNEKISWLCFILIAPKKKGKGLGHLLVKKLISHAKTLHPDSIKLTVYMDNIEALNLYPMHNFRFIRCLNDGKYLMKLKL
ncbi:MAG: hypothetical protein K940chlam7_00351 [Chlamydiae bacterium]|nr:hypothetical protein [Chlamydiota bacterium]